jgi:hypothetical protein
MMQKAFNQTFCFLIPILIGSLLLMSCSASQHAGVSYKRRPALTETNETVWFEYWQDQFDANRGKVIAPPMDYPPVAKSAYDRAAQDWNLKAKEAENQTTIAWVAGSVGVTVLLLVLLFSSAASNTPH